MPCYSNLGRLLKYIWNVYCKKSMASNNKLSFGPIPRMPEVPKGEHAELMFSETGDLTWEYKEDGEYGMKRFTPIVLHRPTK
jgi:hypothetical protein